MCERISVPGILVLQGGEDVNLAEIDESIRLMERRLETGQGTKASAMCRLSLDATKALRGMVTDAQADVDRRSVALGDANKKRRRLEAEVSRLRSKIWQDHQDGFHCFCEDCLAYAESNNMEPVYNDDGDQWDYRKKEDSNGMG